ncbi:hypothetical protein ACET3Z_016440 [Daucus carota]
MRSAERMKEAKEHGLLKKIASWGLKSKNMVHAIGQSFLKLLGCRGMVTAVDNYVPPHVSGTYLYSNPGTDFYSAAWDIIIPLGALQKLKKKYDVVVNIQGDEPLVEPEILDGIVKALQAAPAAVVSTAVTALAPEDAFDLNRVKYMVDITYQWLCKLIVTRIDSL